MLKSRQIIIQTNNKPNESFCCDATKCDTCVVRFQCFTSRSGAIIVNQIKHTFPYRGRVQ